MKYLRTTLALTIFILSAGNLHATVCVDNAFVWPATESVLPSNASVLVTLSGSAIEKFEKESKSLFFQNGKQKVKAKLVKAHTNREGDRKALLFRATKKLTVGKTYTLTVGGKNFSWTVGKVDKKKPKWTEAPKMMELRKGKGTAHYIINTKVTDRSPIFYDVVLKTKDGKKQSYFLLAPTGELHIGRGPCASIFVLPEEGTKVLVEMTPYDFSGNKGKTKKITIGKK